LIVNEIYGLSIINTKHPAIKNEYQKHRKFVSFAPMMQAKQSPYLHLWYALSKDLGISGFRVGILYTLNETLIKGYDNFNVPHLISNHTQWLLSEILVANEGCFGLFILVLVLQIWRWLWNGLVLIFVV